MFSQLESTLGVKLKREFVLNKLFPNDIISDMVEVEEMDIKNDIDSNENKKDEIMSMFEEGENKKESLKFFSITKQDNIDIIRYDLNLSINW